MYGLSWKWPPPDVQVSPATIFLVGQHPALPSLIVGLAGQAAEKSPLAPPAAGDRPIPTPVATPVGSKKSDPRKKLPLLSTAKTGSPSDGTVTPATTALPSSPSFAMVLPLVVEIDQPVKSPLASASPR